MRKAILLMLPFVVSILVSYHTDQLWNIDWVVHKSVHAPASAAFAEDLQAIACNLALSQ